jgi:hypothetical protein
MTVFRGRRIMPTFFCLVAATVCLWPWFRSRAVVADQQTGKPARSATTQPTRVVDERLVRKLLGGESSALDTVETTLARMDEAAERLADRLDPSDDTQTIQKEILAGLDQMIQAAEQNRAGQSKNNQARRSAGRRSSGRRPGRAGVKPGSAKSVPAAKGGHGDADRGKRSQSSTDDGEKSDLARQWGFLPQRDRLEVAQGFDEEFLPKFREQIQRYYRRLAEEAQRSAETITPSRMNADQPNDKTSPKR